MPLPNADPQNVSQAKPIFAKYDSWAKAREGDKAFSMYELLDFLVSVAAKRETVTYGEVNRRFRLSNERHTPRVLGVVSWFTMATEGVPLTVIVVNSQTGLPGKNFDGFLGKDILGRSRKDRIEEAQGKVWDHYSGFPGVNPKGDDAPSGEEETGEVAKGQGFVIDSVLRGVIETHAMGRAIAYFKSVGYRVEDHHQGHPYDLLLTKDSNRRYVEVKGTLTKGESVLVTPGEVDFARRNNTILFILHDITVDKTNHASGGSSRIEDPWRPTDDKLSPTGYLYRV